MGFKAPDREGLAISGVTKAGQLGLGSLMELAALPPPIAEVGQPPQTHQLRRSPRRPWPASAQERL